MNSYTRQFCAQQLKSDVLNDSQREKLWNWLQENNEWIIHQSTRYLDTGLDMAYVAITNRASAIIIPFSNKSSNLTDEKDVIVSCHHITTLDECVLKFALDRLFGHLPPMEIGNITIYQTYCTLSDFMICKLIGDINFDNHVVHRNTFAIVYYIYDKVSKWQYQN